jgi:TP901 family phage tail tape measure protein
MVALPSLSFSVKADLSGLKAVDRELGGLDAKGKSVGQSIGNSLKSAANDAASAFRSAGGKSGDDFGDQFSRGADGKVKGAFSRLAGAAVAAGGDAGKGFANGFKGAIGNVFQGIAQGIGQQLTAGLGSAISGLKGLAIDREAIASYDKARAQVSTLTDDMAGMATMAREVSKAVGGSASQTEVLAASYDVLSAGFSEAADAANVLTAAQKGAIGGQSDLNTVSNATTTILNAYGLASKDAEKVVNQMIGTQNAGKIVVGEYANKIGAVATIAASAGVSLEELNAFIATATVKGVSANSSIDGMRAAISAVLKPSQEASEYAAQLGVNFSAAGLKAGGLSGVLAQLREKNADGAESLTKLFGSVEAVAAIMPSAGDGVKDFAKNLETIKGASAEDAFQKMQNSIAGLSKKNAVLREELALKFQVATSPLFEAANTGMTQLLSSLNEGGALFDGLNKAAASFRDFIAQNPQIIAAMTAAFTELLNGGITLLQDSIIGFTDALRENPQLIQQMIEGLTGAVTQGIAFGQGVGTALTSIINMLTPIAQLVGGMTGAQEGANGLAGAFGQIVVYAAVFGPIVSALGSVVSLGTSIVGLFGGWAAVQVAISGGLATIAGYLGTIVAVVPPIALGFGAVLITVENIKNYSANWNDVLLGVRQTWEDLTGWVSGIFDWIGQLVSRSEVFQNVWGVITGIIQVLIEPYKDIFDAVVSLVQKSEFFQGIWNGMPSIIDGIGNAFNTVVGGALDGLMQKAQALFGQMQQMAGFGGGGAQGINSGSLGDTGGLSADAQATLKSDGFIEKLNKVANHLGASSEDLLTAMLYESAGTLSPSIRGPNVPGQGAAAGLIQFMPDTARGLGTSSEALAGMSATQQLDYVQKYFEPFKGRLGSYDALYKTIHAGNPDTSGNLSDGYRTTNEAIADANSIYRGKAKAALSGGGSTGGSFGGGASGIAGFANSFPGGASLSSAPTNNTVANKGGGAGSGGTSSTPSGGASKTTAPPKNAKTKMQGSITGQLDASGQNGADMDVGPNNEMYSYHNGRVTELGNAGNNGNYVVVSYLDELGNQLEATYSHIGAIVKKGDQVIGGQVLGKFDGSGRTFGAHNSIDINTPGTNGALQRDREGAAARRGADMLVKGIVQGQGGNATMADTQSAKDAENDAMKKAVDAARSKEDNATKIKREAAAAKLKQDREASKLSLEGSAASLTTPEAKEASARALKELEVRAQYEDRLLDLQQKRDDLVKARDRKKTDSASKDVGVAAAAKALPDFSSQIKAYDALIAKDKELQSTALKNIGIADEAKQKELDRLDAINNRNSALEKQIELEKSEGQLALERAARTNPILAQQIQFANQRKDLQSALNKELQDELDKLSDIERKLEELAKIGQKDSPEIRRLEAQRNTVESRIQNIKSTNKNRLTGLNESQQFEGAKLKRDRDVALLDKDSMMASGGIEARKKQGARMREFGNVDGANKVEKEAALTELTLSYRQKQLALEAKIADMRSKGIEVSEAETAAMRDQISALEQADLSNLNRQFDTFQSEIMPTIQSSLGGFFKTLMDGSKSVDEAFTDMIGNITNKIFEFAANQIVSSLLGGMMGGGGGGGFGGGIMKIFGMAEGGVVEAQNNIAPLRARPDAIGAALRKEGSNSVLAALTPGEMVLTTRQTSAFLNNPMASEILNFAQGGIVGKSGSPMMSQNNAVSSSAVNIALNVDGGRSEMDYAMVAKVAQRAASGEISRQQKPRGSLSR